MEGTRQIGLQGISLPAQQTEMLAEFSGKTGSKTTLIDIDKYRATIESRPIPGQITFEGEVIQ